MCARSDASFIHLLIHPLFTSSQQPRCLTQGAAGRVPRNPRGRRSGSRPGLTRGGPRPATPHTDARPLGALVD